jgi:hypothetical protein
VENFYNDVDFVYVETVLKERFLFNWKMIGINKRILVFGKIKFLFKKIKRYSM